MSGQSRGNGFRCIFVINYQPITSNEPKRQVRPLDTRLDRLWLSISRPGDRNLRYSCFTTPVGCIGCWFVGHELRSLQVFFLLDLPLCLVLSSFSRAFLLLELRLNILSHSLLFVVVLMWLRVFRRKDLQAILRLFLFTCILVPLSLRTTSLCSAAT